MTIQFQPRDPAFKSKVADSFAAQNAMATVGADLISVEPGIVVIGLKYSDAITQQNGFVHAGIISTVMDSACGYAAFSLMPEEAQVLTIEFKINLLAPAQGEYFRAIGKVRKTGKCIFVAEADLVSSKEGEDNGKLIATMGGTLMAMYPATI